MEEKNVNEDLPVDVMDDDGSLACLNLTPNPNGKFRCPKTSQQKLVNRTFWVVDFQRDQKTSHNDKAYVVKIKHDLNNENTAEKFFTASQDIIYVLEKLDEMKKFPRRVTLKAEGTAYYFE